MKPEKTDLEAKMVASLDLVRAHPDDWRERMAAEREKYEVPARAAIDHMGAGGHAAGEWMDRLRLAEVALPLDSDERKDIESARTEIDLILVRLFRVGMRLAKVLP